MKKLFALFAFLLVLSANAQHAGKRCYFDDGILELSKNTEFVNEQTKLEELIKLRAHLKSGSIFQIPVVVHIIYRENSENISLAQIQSQFDVLNEDYRKRNSDTTNVEAGFSIADVGIEFCLASRDPNGLFTNGINRYQTSIDNIGDFISNPRAFDSIIAEAPAWNRNEYLNIWVCDMGNLLAGFATPPGAPANKDGVVIHTTNFGRTGNVQNNYDLGRTASHEVGHYLNLLHPWGNNASCSQDDGVADTPNQDQIYQQCPSIPQSSCGSKDMLSNFMGYLYDRCLGNFTEGQKERMRIALVNSRSSLLLSKGCTPTSIKENDLLNQVEVWPNPMHDQTFIKIPQIVLQKPHQIALLNQTGQVVAMQTKMLENGYQIQLNKAAKGVYFLHFQGSEFAFTKKLVIH